MRTHESLLWVGSYTVDRNGHGKGITALSADSEGGLTAIGLAVEANSPSFLALHPTLPVVYAVAEEGKTVGAYRRSGDTALEAFGDPWPAGDATCHVAADPQGRSLIHI
ncbi:lactonase family protein [Paenarthrobacter nicotinovorans]|uniref:lactonase family protein n=1 Tax=Paenarthrobacter nicotinovorans TaxID=29320 RepID=UPI002485C2F2|nr:beta-propeller fold lactonase family protein [Paenarthrobacter nicotinovorans]MDI2022404.1 hypothetical protein [Paenarthrobacter nicotinovorans]